ncbi:MAG: toll/interleukin-1 receptor domain-containing protein [Desulfobacteraceae bacterium]|nr:toll/interleukin-1 receptor domain-containing protein [Desulfobacteraceae bacterium]
MKVFISYAREDIETAGKLYHDLKQAGISPWMDKEDILIGENWKVAIRQAMKESSYFLALLSSNSLSKQGYVQKELKMALDILSEMPPSGIFLLPVRLDDCHPLDERLQDINWGDLFPSYEEGFQKILRVLSQDRQKAMSSPGKKEDIPVKKEADQKETQPLKTESSEENIETSR